MDEKSKQRVKTGLKWALFAAFLWGFWWWRPFWHDLVYAVIYKHPMTWVSLLFGAAIVAWGWAKHKTTGKPRNMKGLIVFATIVVVFLGLTFGNWWAGMKAREHEAGEMQAQAEMLDALPEVDAENPRILPGGVARNYASNSLQLPRHEVAGGSITMVNGTPQWSFTLNPDGAVNTFVKKQDGASFVRMTTSTKDVRVQHEEFDSGTGMLLTDALGWGLAKEEYWREYKDPFVVPTESGLALAVPMKTEDLHFDFPVVYSEPEFAGVALVHPDGEREYLSPDEARSHPALQDQRFYPYGLARYQVESMAYKNGIANKLFYHEDELEVASVPGDADQPFTYLAEDGIRYVVAAEPYGNAQGIFEVWTFDAQTGEPGVLEMDRDSSLLGPRKGVQFVRKAFPRVDWTRFNVTEPLPAVVDETLYWHVKVQPPSGAGIAFSAFVDADTGNVTRVDADRDVRRFLRGVPVNQTTESSARDDPAPSMPPAHGDANMTATNGTVTLNATVTAGNQTVNVTIVLPPSHGGNVTRFELPPGTVVRFDRAGSPLPFLFRVVR